MIARDLQIKGGHMKKKLALLLMTGALSLTGCSGENNIGDQLVKTYVMKTSGIENDVDYKKYVEYKESGLLSEDGEYNKLEKEQNQIDNAVLKKQVHVTIAENSFLNVSYYFDAGLSQKVEERSIYLDPGEKLFCSQPESKNAYSSTYVFSEFQIFEFGEDGTRGNLWKTGGEDSLVLEIPADYIGTELSIMPTGIYEKRGLTFRAFFYDENNTSKSVPGVWLVNDEVCPEQTADVGASDNYIVKYQYDENAYYYVSADPVPYNTEIPGLVEFKKATSLSSADIYSVQLHQLIRASFSYDNLDKKGILSVEKNGEKVEEFNQNEITGLKAGDKLVITTTEKYRLFCSEMKMNEPEVVEGGFRYTVLIPETNETEYVFKVSKSELKVTLDSSVGYDMAFDIVAAGVSEKGRYFSKQKFNEDLTIFEDTIGVEEKITISAREQQIEAGTAIKVEGKKVDGNGQEINEIKYIRSTPGNAEIALYDGLGEITNLNKIYKKIAIKISLVNVTEFLEKQIDHGTVVVKLIDCTVPESLLEGFAAEEDRKVEVSIIPESGYYVSGIEATDQEYIDTMKYSKYLSDIDAIIKTHEIKKLITVTLDDSDQYGKTIYKQNGIEVSGLVKLREEDKLTLEYELTDTNYKIDRESEGFLDGVNNWRKNMFDKNKEVVTIEPTQKMDLTTIKRSDYISVSTK